MSQPQDPAEYQHQRLSDEITKIQGLIEQATQDERPRLPERHFREIFLPLFAGDENRMYANADLNTWVNHAGGPYREVDIIGESGEVLFTVPPLLDRSAVNPVPINGAPPISHVVASAQQYARIHPLQGARHLNAELTQRALVMKVPANVLKDLEAWNAIFTRYGRPPLVALPEGEETSTGSDSQNNKGAPDFEFDPL